MSRRYYIRQGRRSRSSSEDRSERVTRGLADAFGIPRGMVIAGFVIGFVFVPLLPLLTFLIVLYWVNDPERTRRLGRFHSSIPSGERATGSGAVRRARGTAAAQARLRPRIAGAEAPGASTPPPSHDGSSESSGSARAIEELVASEEYRLNREFRRMERE